MYMTLYRGITVGPEQVSLVKSRIQADGLGQGDTWRLETADLRPRLQDLFDKPDLTTSDTRPSRWVETATGGYRELLGGFPVVCACGDLLGANYYAARHNYSPRKGHTCGLVVTFQADVADVFVDGRDFLYNSVFRDARSTPQRDLACRLFGQGLGRYLDRAMAHSDTSYKFAMCDLATQDEEVVLAHARNDLAIGGRCGTVFRSAFLVRVPVAAHNVVSVENAGFHDFRPQVTLESFHELGDESR